MVYFINYPCVMNSLFFLQQHLLELWSRKAKKRRKNQAENWSSAVKTRDYLGAFHVTLSCLLNKAAVMFGLRLELRMD